MEDKAGRFEGRQYSRQRKARESLIGTDSTGAEYWLVPFKDSTVGNRQFEIRKSKKQVPVDLQGMITDAATAERMFKAWVAKTNASKRTTKKTADAD